MQRLDIDRVAIWINDVCVVRDGSLAVEYTEVAAMSFPEIRVRIFLGSGRHAARVWTCDFSHDYVSINADYRT